ncbi:MAG: hypothetical protein IPI08_07900 [Betaproteobacteria bacterium]|nr:hypothetical protein [Betaproteobacteria bacterium]
MENGVGYVKKNFLAGQEFIDFSAVQPAAQLWVDTWADVRVRRHAATARGHVRGRTCQLKRLNPAGFDLARVRTVSVNKQFRVALDSNTYSVPSRHVGQRLTMKAWADRVCIYAQGRSRRTPPAQHAAAQGLRASRTRPATRPAAQGAREQRLLTQFLALSPRAQAYREGWRRGA